MGLEDQFVRVSGLMDACSARISIPRGNLCDALMRHWLTDGIIDEKSLKGAFASARLIVGGACQAEALVQG